MSENFHEEASSLLERANSKSHDPSGGITRLLYTKEWKETQYELKKIMEEAGLNTYFDEIGNLYGRLDGSLSENETVATGSHADSVKNGGKYDGMYGIIAGIAAIGQLKKEHGMPLRNLEVISFAEEEGSRFPFVYWGSKNFLGVADNKDVENLKDHDGVSFQEAIKNAGFSFSQGKKGRSDVKYFLEAHIEQGNVLEREEKEIGVVTCIAGQRRFDISVTGVANHAGTTPMQYRSDALYAASKMISEITDRAKKHGAPLVATTGFIEVKPNVVNVVPGHADFSLDIRHTDTAFLKSFADEAVALMNEIAEKCMVTVDVNMWMNAPSVPMDNKLAELLKNTCDSLRLNYKVMHSGAGHDSQLIAGHIPTAMLFVPSKNGISHNPEEYTAPEYLEAGVKALKAALYELTYK